MNRSCFSKFLGSREVLFLGAFSFLTRFFSIGFPSKVVFDEAHFGLYASKYLTHQYYFDIHPPLGKILLSISGFFGKIDPGFYFAPGSDYSDFNFISLRFLPALFGSLLVLLVYFFVKELGFSKRAAFLSGFLVLFDNALIVQSRFVLLDIVLVFFIFLSLYLFFLTKKFSSLSSKWLIFNILTGLSLGAAISIKWIGIGALGIVWFLAFKEIPLKEVFKKEHLLKIFSLFFLPLFIYFLIFFFHFSLLPFTCDSNCGTIFDFYLKDSSLNFNRPPEGNFFQKFIEVHKLMLAGNFILETDEPFYYQSEWYDFPFMIRPILYFKEPQNQKTSYVFLLGNPIVWWAGIIGIIGVFYLLVKNYFYSFKLKIPSSFYSDNLSILIFGYLIYLIPFSAIDRSLALYHYLPALIFLIIIFSVFFDGILETFFLKKKANLIFLGFLFLVFITFLFFSPLTYGFPLTKESFQLRMWLPTWSI